MTKTGPLSKAEKFYIEQKYSEMGVEQICKELDRAKKVVKAHAKSQKLEEQSKVSKTRLAEQFANNNKGSIVMTENAAIIADELKGRSGPTGRSRECVTKIRNE